MVVDWVVYLVESSADMKAESSVPKMVVQTVAMLVASKVVPMAVSTVALMAVCLDDDSVEMWAVVTVVWSAVS